MSRLSDIIPDPVMRELLAELYPANPGFANELAWAMYEGMIVEAEWVGAEQKTAQTSCKERPSKQMRLGDA